MKNIILVLTLMKVIFGFSGSIYSDTTWTDNIIITGDVTIEEGALLVITGGVTVSFTKVDQNQDGIGDSDFIVNGRLMCNGSPTQKIIFTSNEDNKQSSDWSGIDYQSSQQTVFYSTEIYYAHQGMHVNGNYINMYNSKIENSGDYGMRIENSTATTTLLETSIMENGGYGLNIESGDVSISGGLIFGNGDYGLNVEAPVNLDVNGLIVSSNASTGIWIDGTQGATFDGVRSVSNGEVGILIDGADPSFTNSLISNNTGIGVKIQESSSNPFFDHCDILENNGGGFSINDGCSTNITYSNILDNNGFVNPGIFVQNNSALTVNNCNIENNYSSSGEFSFNPESTLNLYQSGCTSSGRDQTSNTWQPLGEGNILTSVFSSISMKVISSSDDCSSSQDWNFQIKDQDGNDLINWNGSNQFNYNQWVDLPLKTGYKIRQWHDYFDWVDWNITEAKLNSSLGNVELVTINSSASLDAQHNWWGTINGVDNLVIQSVAGTVNYEQLQISEVFDAGASYENNTPSLSVTSPSEMVVNPDNIVITWSDIDVDNDAVISFFFEEEFGSGGTEIVSGISEDDETDSYTWDISNVPYGIYYIYGVVDDGSNDPLTSYAPSQVMVGPLVIQMSEDLSAPAGGTIIIPIEIINPLPEYDITAINFIIGYDSWILSDPTVSNENTLTSNWNIISNNAIPGQLEVGGYAVDSIDERGVLINLEFTVNELANNFSTTVLNVNEFNFNDYAPGELDVEINNGYFTIVNEYTFSGKLKYYGNENGIPDGGVILTGEDSEYTATTDENGDFSFTPMPSLIYSASVDYNEEIPEMIILPADAALTASYSVGLEPSFTTDQYNAAEVSGDGIVDIYDASLILQYSVGLINSFESGRWSFSGLTSLELLEDMENQEIKGIAIGDPTGNWSPPDRDFTEELLITANEGEEIFIPISTQEEFRSIYLDIQFNSENLQFQRLEGNALLNNFTTAENNETGQFRFGSFSQDFVQLEETAYIIVLYALAKLIDEPISLNSIFNEDNNSTLSVETSGQIIPNHYKLNNNYPNPFNPVTTISWQMPEMNHHKIIVYNMLGEIIEILSEGIISAGYHSILWNAETIPSGVYIVKLESNQKVIDTRKMLLIK